MKMTHSYGEYSRGKASKSVIIKKQKKCTVFLSSYTNTSGSLGEQEMLWEYEPQVTVSTAFSSLYNSIETQYMFSISFRKQRDEKMENNLLTLIIKM